MYFCGRIIACVCPNLYRGKLTNLAELTGS